MSKTIKNAALISIVFVATVAGGLGFARYFAPEMYDGFCQGVQRIAWVQKIKAITAELTLGSQPQGNQDANGNASPGRPLASSNIGKGPSPKDWVLTDLPQNRVEIEEEEMRGVWIASVLNIDFPKNPGNWAKQKQELLEILDTAKSAGLNTVFFQVRPLGDALYQSEIFPWSIYLTGVEAGSEGEKPDYDPLAFIISEADKRGLRVHAWINPYRLTMGSKDKPQTSHDYLAGTSPVKTREDLTLAGGDGKLYLNPGEPAARDLVVAGVVEIIENYKVDGIHFDDYFYPDASYDDSGTFAQYGKAGQSLEDWRRDNTSLLIKMVKEAIATHRPGVDFGISPSGIWQNQKTDPLGSATNGFESYNRIFADSRLWVKEELVDYIVPQLYWAIGTKDSDYEVLARWWVDVVKGTRVKLYIGHGIYRLGAEGAWSKPTEIGRQMTLNRALGSIGGSVFYGYSKIVDNTLGIRDQLKDFFLDPELAQPFKIAYPQNNHATTAANSYIIGSADPRYPLYINNELIEPTISGYFSVFVPLSVGENKFTFSYKGEDFNYVLKRNSAGTGGSSGGSGSSQSPGPKITNFAEPMVYVTKGDQTVVRSEPQSSAQRLEPLKKGVTGRVTAEANGYYLMDSGNWTYKPNVEVFTDRTLEPSVVSKASLTMASQETVLSFHLPYFTSYYVQVEEGEVLLSLHQTQGISLIAEANPLFGGWGLAQEGPHAVYQLSLKNPQGLYGYRIEYDEKTKVLSFSFNNPPKAAEGEQDLKGITIVVDAGHGGNDNGALGPAGARGKVEKDFNLELALEVERLLKEAGAEVIMTRQGDYFVELEARAQLIRDKSPDLAISLHRNSIAADKDISKYKGVLALYSHQQSLSLAKHLSDALMQGTNHYYDGIRWQSLAVCRIEECPTVLLELGFVTNPSEYERMNRRSYIVKEARAIVAGIRSYLS